MTIENRAQFRWFVGALTFGISIFGAQTPVFAQTSAEDSARGAARRLGYDGVSAYQSGDLEQASIKLEKAYEVLPIASLALWSARVHRDQGHWVEASERYLECTRKAPDDGGDREVQLKSQEECRTERAALTPRIPLLTVAVKGEEIDSFSFTINEVAHTSALANAEIPANPGTVRVRGESGGREVEVVVELLEGASGFVVLDFGEKKPVDLAPAPLELTAGDGRGVLEQPEVAPGRSWQRPVGWVGIGVGSAGIIFGAVVGLLALDKQKDLNCDKGECPSDTDKDEVDSFNTFRDMSSIGFIAGGVLVAGGVTLLLTSPKKTTTATLNPYIGLTSLGVQGSF